MFKKIVVSIILIGIIFVCGMYFQSHMNQNNTNKTNNTNTIDTKIKKILAVNKMESLEIIYTSTLTNNSFNEPSLSYFKDLSKFFTSKKLILTGDYKGIFTYDLSKATFTRKLDTYDINISAKDLTINTVQLNALKTEETLSLVGNYYDSSVVAELSQKLNSLARDNINTPDNKILAMTNTKENLLKLFTNVGIDINKVNIKIYFN